MNINEVSMLDVNFWAFYRGSSRLYARIQMGNWLWVLDDKIVERSYALTSQELLNDLFKWVFR